MKVSAATRARRREATRTGHQLPAAMANALAWDVILALGPRIGGMPVVRFQGRYYLVDTRVGAPNKGTNPWPTVRRFCKLLARPDDPVGDLVVGESGVVYRWHPVRGWTSEAVGVNDDIEPVLSLPVAGAFTAAGTVRPAVPGPGEVQDDEQLHG